MTRARVWRELRPFVGPTVILAVYLVTRVAFALAAGSSGVMTPSGGVSRGIAVLAFATFVLRLCALVLVPGVVVYRLVMRIIAPANSATCRSAARATRRSGSGPA